MRPGSKVDPAASIASHSYSKLQMPQIECLQGLIGSRVAHCPRPVLIRGIVTQRANVPCEYRTSPRRRHASSIGAIGSRADALCSRALCFRKPSEAFREGQSESFLDQSLGFLASASATVGVMQIACNGCVRLTISASGQSRRPSERSKRRGAESPLQNKEIQRCSLMSATQGLV